MGFWSVLRKIFGIGKKIGEVSGQASDVAEAAKPMIDKAVKRGKNN